MPSRPQVPPPRPNGASQITRTAPLSRSTMANLPAAKKPIRRLSGDQNGSNAPSVPLICCALDADSARTQSLSFPSGPKATKASRVPSGETEKLLCSKYQLDGGRIDERVGGLNVGRHLRTGVVHPPAQEQRKHTTGGERRPPENRNPGQVRLLVFGFGGRGEFVAEILSTGATKRKPCFGIVSM